MDESITARMRLLFPFLSGFRTHFRATLLDPIPNYRLSASLSRIRRSRSGERPKQRSPPKVKRSHIRVEAGQLYSHHFMVSSFSQRRHQETLTSAELWRHNVCTSSLVSPATTVWPNRECQSNVVTGALTWNRRISRPSTQKDGWCDNTGRTVQVTRHGVSILVYIGHRTHVNTRPHPIDTDNNGCGSHNSHIWSDNRPA
jgi:hypothetical protein